MAYTRSQAVTGLGSILSMGNGASPEVFIAVGEIRSLSQTGRQAKTDDVTNLQSGAVEFIPTLVDSGTYDFTCNRVGGDAGQIAMENAFNGLTLHNFKLQLIKSGSQTTTGDLYTFYGLIQELSYTFAPDKAVTFTGKLRVSGLITYTAGS
jgi:hypothetical protein